MVPLDVARDPLVTTNVAHISIATYSVWGTFLPKGGFVNPFRAGGFSDLG